MNDLRDYVQHKLNCLRGQVVTPVACPSCGEPMNPVRNNSGYLNRDQFDAVKAGDWFCKRHETEVVYAWDHKLPQHGCTCGLEAALAAAPVTPTEMQTVARLASITAEVAAAPPALPCTCGPPSFANEEHDGDCPRGLAAAPPAEPPRWCVFDSVEGVASCGGHNVPLQHTRDGWVCRLGKVTFEFGCAFGQASRSATFAREP